MDWLNFLAEEVKRHWFEKGTAYNLARVKPFLDRNFSPLQNVLRGRKLRAAIEEDGGSLLKIIKNPNDSLTWGLVPAEIDLPVDFTELFSVKSERRSKPDSTLRFSRTVWSAFSHSLPENLRRYLIMGSPVLLRDISDTDMPPPGGIQIGPEYIFDHSSEAVPNSSRDQVIEANIKAWAELNAVLLSDLVKAPRAKNDSASPSLGSPYLVADFTALTDDERSRILIPLNLLSKIKFGKQ
jgi:hypothetical protein